MTSQALFSKIDCMLSANQKSDSELNSNNNLKCLSLLLHWKVNICKAFQTESVHSSYADYSICTCTCIHVSTNDVMREILVNFTVEHCNYMVALWCVMAFTLF